MDEIYKIVANKELVVRKKVASIIEKMLRYLGYDLHHDRYKKIIYSESPCVTEEEHYIKSLYDGFMYLLNNRKTTITNKLLKKFFFIITGTLYDDYLLSSIAKYYFDLNEISPIEKAVNLNIFMYKTLSKELNILLISYMMLSFILVKYDIPCIQITRKDISCYEQLLEKGEKEELFLFVYKLIKEAKYMDKDFYKNLRPLLYIDIYKTLKEEESFIKGKYKVKEVILYGSFIKEINRIDSDIDLLVKMSEDLTFIDKKKNIEEMKVYLTNKFNRYVDIDEVTSIMRDSLLIELTDYKRII